MLENGLVRALGWLRRNGAQVVNVSATARPYARALRDAVRALELSGALVVASTGNGDGLTYPAALPGVLGVGALAPRIDQEGLVEIDAWPAGRPGGAGRGHQGGRLDVQVDEPSRT